MKIAITAIAAIAGAATASPYFTVANGVEGMGQATAGAVATITVDLSGINSWDLQFDSDNEFLDILMDPNAHIVGVGWDVTIQAVGGISWLSEAVIDLNGSLFITPGVGDDFGGTGTYSSGGILDLVGLTLDFFLDGTGNMHLDFFESFDDVADGIDNVYLQGSSLQIQYEVPAPGALAMLGLGGLVAGRRRR